MDLFTVTSSSIGLRPFRNLDRARLRKFGARIRAVVDLFFSDRRDEIVTRQQPDQ